MVDTNTSEFEHFMKAHQNLVFSVAVRLLGNDAEAADIPQEVFLRAYDRFADLEHNPAAPGWLRTVTHNLCLNHLTRYRARWRFFSDWFQPDSGSVPEEWTSQTADPSEKDDLEFRRYHLEKALRKLPNAQRVPLVLYHFEEVAVYQYAGHHFGHQTGLTLPKNPLGSVLVGTLLFYLLYMVPLIGFVAWGTAATFGFGAVFLAAAQALRKELPASDADTNSIPLVPVKSPSASTSPTETSAEPILLPRAGFWIRLTAAVLDLILVGALVSLSGLKSVFLPIWLAYHLSMWSWKSTTIGGLVFGLKIVRTNGEPAAFAVALIRLLAAFFSALVLFLGFVWVAWHRERQSWHDILSGTIIVRFPKGTPLI